MARTPHIPVEESVSVKPQIADGVGLGIDIVAIARMERILGRTSSFRTRVFTEGERAYCEKTSHPATHYATRFAAKEAVLKALGTGFARGIGPQDVEVVRTSKGRPVAKLHRKAAEVAKEMGVVDLPISLSFTHDEAVACAMAITVDSLNAAARRKDPMEELAKQFKEARAMLDDLPATGIDVTEVKAGDAPVAIPDGAPVAALDPLQGGQLAEAPLDGGLCGKTADGVVDSRPDELHGAFASTVPITDADRANKPSTSSSAIDDIAAADAADVTAAQTLLTPQDFE